MRKRGRGEEEKRRRGGGGDRVGRRGQRWGDGTDDWWSWKIGWVGRLEGGER